MTFAISVENLSKQFRLGARQLGGYRTLRESLVDVARLPWARLRALGGRRQGRAARPTASADDRMWALKDVSFEIRPGEVVGLIGRNGAGKSTLLKVLSRITEPTEGRARLRGRVGSLLEVGTGFHNELTGRENIYLNGSILGMSRREISRKFDEIVAFAEMDRFLDTPVKRYSSGMYVRLAFAVAAYLEPEILLVDEVLAVGDQAFQGKCLGKMGDVARSGRTVVLVSHNMASILHLCRQVAVLDRGRLAFVGDCEAGVERYLESSRATTGLDCELSDHPGRRPGMRPHFRALRVRDGKGHVTNQIGCGDPVQFEIALDTAAAASDYNVQIGVEDHMGVRLFTLATNFSAGGSLPLSGRGRVVCSLDQFPLCPGRYALSVFLGPVYKPLIDAVDQALWLEVVAKDFFGNGRLPHSSEGRLLVRSRWESDDPEEAVCS
jgi:lipopolysaccharide transport system ATP-binding protein